jgi:hypothetical protein
MQIITSKIASKIIDIEQGNKLLLQIIVTLSLDRKETYFISVQMEVLASLNFIVGKSQA